MSAPRRPTAFALLIGSLLAAAAATFAFIVVPHERAHAIEEWGERLAALARDREVRILHMVRNHRGDAAIAAAFPTVVSLVGGASHRHGGGRGDEHDHGGAHLVPILDSVVRARDAVGLYALDDRGHVVVASSSAPHLEARVRRRAVERPDEPWFETGPDGRPWLAFAAPVVENGRRLGAALLVLDARWLYGAMDVPGAPGAEVFLVAREEGALHRLTPARSAPDAPLPRRLEAPPPGFSADARPHGYGPARDEAGRELYALARPVGALSWHIVAAVEREAALAEARLRLRAFGWALAAFALALVGVTVLVQRERRARDLREANVQLRQAVRERTEEIAAIETTVAHEAQLRQAQKMEALGNLAGGVAHDFNNLLTAITGHAELALADPRLDAGLHEHIDGIRSAAERAAALTGRLLAFSRKQVVQPRVLDLNALIVETGALLRRVIAENVSIETSLAPDLGRVRADANQLVQILLNLAVNARDAMPRGGVLTIRTANARPSPEVAREHGMPDEPAVLLEVADNGVGMDAATMARIFEPFFTTKAQSNGTGLGLSTVYGIVRQSGGAILVDSEPDKGARFRIYLPRVEAVAEARVEKAAGPAVGAGETILLVEDDDLVRSLVERSLSARGYRVVATPGPEAALAEAARLPRLDLLLTDVVMPAMNGRELARAISKEHPSLRVLFMSGYTTGALATEGRLADGLAFLQKPFRPDELDAKVRAVLDAPAGTYTA